MSDQSIPSVDPSQVPEDGYLLDVREDDEWQAGHAPQAHHVPLQQLPLALSELPADGPVYVVCRTGGRSAQAVMWLTQQGRDAVNVEGGMQRWSSLGKPMQSESDTPPQVI